MPSHSATFGAFSASQTVLFDCTGGQGLAGSRVTEKRARTPPSQHCFSSLWVFSSGGERKNTRTPPPPSLNHEKRTRVPPLMEEGARSPRLQEKGNRIPFSQGPPRSQRGTFQCQWQRLRHTGARVGTTAVAACIPFANYKLPPY